MAVGQNHTNLIVFNLIVLFQLPNDSVLPVGKEHVFPIRDKLFDDHVERRRRSTNDVTIVAVQIRAFEPEVVLVRQLVET